MLLQFLFLHHFQEKSTFLDVILHYNINEFMINFSNAFYVKYCIL